MNTKTLAIVLVAVIVVAGVIIAVPTLMNDDEPEEDLKVGEGRMLIYGNANMDDTINQKDVDTLEKIISGEEKKTKFADANQDGKVDQADVEMVKKMINREPMTLFYLNMYTQHPQSIKYPVKDIVSMNNDINVVMKILGTEDKLTGYKKPNDMVLYDDFPKDAAIFTSDGQVPIETISKIKCDAVLALAKESNVQNEEELLASGIPTIRLGLSDADSAPAYLTLGFLIQVEDRAKEYVDFSDKILEHISKTVNASVAQDDKIRAMVLGYNVIYGLVSDYGTIIDMAGGVNAVDWYEHRFCKNGYEWLYNYDFDYIVGLANPAGYDLNVDPDAKADIRTIWDRHYNRYEKTDAVAAGNLVILDNNMPVLLKACYIAGEFYPDLLGQDFGDKIHQEYIDKFIGNLHEDGFKVGVDGIFMLTPEIMVNYP